MGNYLKTTWPKDPGGNTFKMLLANLPSTEESFTMLSIFKQWLLKQSNYSDPGVQDDHKEDSRIVGVEDEGE